MFDDPRFTKIDEAVGTELGEWDVMTENGVDNILIGLPSYIRATN